MLSPRVASSLLLVLAAAGVDAQQPLWGQCGGNNWTGGRTCVSGSVCTELNPWYHQCLPGTAATTAQPQPTTTAQPTTAAPPTTLTTVTQPQQPTTTTNPNPNPNPGTCPAVPGSISGSWSTLNDPFTFAGGAKVTSKADWECRQKEISQLLQRYELGTLPEKPTVTSSLSGNTLTINVSANGKSISFSVTISNLPSGTGPHPAIINYGTYGASIPVPAGVATIGFNNDDIAAQQSGSSRGQGKFYTLYGSSHSAGALTAWAWGVSRIIDALEQQPGAGIDPKRLGVTGCSRNGKGAIVAGALEPRIALTLPQESGAGGSGCWRIAGWQKSQGTNVQDAPQIVTENVWFSPTFNNYVNSVNSLPFDHHLLAGLIAPRALYVMENTDMEWLGKLSTYGCMAIARKQWEALGALNNFGYSQVGGNSHCSFPSSQQGTELNAFIGKFLLNNANAGTTNILRTSQNHNFNLATWSPWTVPTLS
ncbi:hypothetical protein OQA88_5616 [Cercophora sp. LCS_1]